MCKTCFTGNKRKLGDKEKMDNKEGRIEIIIGCMFSGKTTELFRRLNIQKYSGMPIVVFKYSKDTRYERGALACSHDGITLSALPVSKLLNKDVPENIKVIGIDEGQFMDNLVEFCEYQASIMNRVVIISALDSDFKREPFQSIIDLVPKAEKVDKLSAVCINCKKSASFTKRIVESSEQELIGGSDMYIPVCRYCHTGDIDQQVIKQYQSI